MSEPTDVLDPNDSTTLDDGGDDSTDNDGNASEPLVGDDGLINLDNVENDEFREVAEQVNNRISQMAEELERSRPAAQHWQTIVNNPKAVKYLYEQQYGKVEDEVNRSHSEDLDFSIDLDIDDDDFADTGGIKKLAQKLADQTGTSLKKAIRQVEQTIVARVQEQLSPTIKALGESSKVAKWQSVVSRYPEANTPEYRKEIETVLQAGRVAADDYEAAFEIADARIQRTKRGKSKSDTTRRKGRAGAAASRSTPRGGRTNADDLSSKGKGWRGAIEVATKRVGALPKS